MEPRWLTTQKAAEYIGLDSRRTLERLRAKDSGPAYSKRGTTYFYRVTDLDEWLEAGRIEPSSIPRQKAAA